MQELAGKRLFRVTGFSGETSRSSGKSQEKLLSANFKIRAASAIYPDACPVTSPGSAFNALRTAALANQADLATNPFAAPVTLPIAGFTVEGLNISATIPATIIIPLTIPATIIIPLTIPATTIVAIT
jgi:hypothetical protein